MDQRGEHRTAPAAPGKAGGGAGSSTTPESITPQQAARRALAAIDPSTKVTVDGTASVAGRSAYELVLVPRDARSLVGDVRIAVDSETGVPLRVQVHAAGSSGRPAFETAFSSVTFARPSADVFRFAPPQGATVTELDGSGGGAGRTEAPGEPQADSKGSGPTVIGSGWTAVVEMTGVSLTGAAGGSGGPDGSAAGQLDALTGAMTPVQGAFGGGRVLRTALLSVLLTDDGRLYVGSVAPSVLEQVAGR